MDVVLKMVISKVRPEEVPYQAKYKIRNNTPIKIDNNNNNINGLQFIE